MCLLYCKESDLPLLPSVEIMAFVAFRLEEFAFALQEKYSKETHTRTGTESS